MPASPTTGRNAIVKWTTPVGGTEITISNSSWDLDIVNRVKEAPNTVDGMVRAAGLEDATGSVKGFVDTTNVIEADVENGDIGTLKLYRNATKFFSMVAIISNLKITTGVDDLEEWSFDFALQSGAITMPA
jgi:AICAR transformylase/IMP cyclohydrolase PurH